MSTSRSDQSVERAEMKPSNTTTQETPQTNSSTYQTQETSISQRSDMNHSAETASGMARQSEQKRNDNGDGEDEWDMVTRDDVEGSELYLSKLCRNCGHPQVHKMHSCFTVRVGQATEKRNVWVRDWSPEGH